jgi:hypothetical protein
VKTHDDVVDVTIRGERRRAPISRREAMQWVLAAVAASAAPSSSFADPALPVGRSVAPQEEAAKIPDPDGVHGYGTDPKLVKIYKPGELWPLTFTRAQKKTCAALADVILPKDNLGPAASEVGVVEMIDEWISAPYTQQKNARPAVLGLLEWVDEESQKRFGKTFVESSGEQHRALCDDVCALNRANGPLRKPAVFFSIFRALCAGAYYATPPGWEAIGYVGNVALEKFDGPPPAVLERLGIEQTVK